MQVVGVSGCKAETPKQVSALSVAVETGCKASGLITTKIMGWRHRVPKTPLN